MNAPPDSHDDHEQNRRSWNAVTAAHNAKKLDQAAFLRAGNSTLFPEEIELLGDVRGKRLAHLQCNCGQDTLSLAGLGATVTGVDISDEAIAFANALSRDTEIAATFHRNDVLHWLATTDERFDVAFASYGAIGWLSDIDAWARGVARILRPGGRLVYQEFHPLVWSFTADGRLTESYFLDDPIQEATGVGDYVNEGLAPSGFKETGETFQNPERAVSYQWTLAQTVQAIASAGLRIEVLREHPYANGCEVIKGLVMDPDRRYRMPAGQPQMPLMFGIAAIK